ncbi:MAG: hypothetical protein WCH85_03820 [Methanomicrobiales archaeon]
MIPFGLISLAGCIGVIRYLERYSPHWFLGIPLAVVFAGGILSASHFILVYIQAKSPLDVVSVGTQVWGTAFLLALGPCAFILLIACSPIVADRQFFRFSLILTGIIALVPLVLLGDMLCVGLRITGSAYFVHPMGEGFMLLYGIIGSPVIGLLVAITARHLPSECENEPFTG